MTLDYWGRPPVPRIPERPLGAAHNEALFNVEDRDRVRQHMLELARGDSRVVAGAEVGSLALGEGDRWSDIDLSFAIADDVAVTDVLDDWTNDLISRFDAVHLFDLQAGASGSASHG